MAGVGISVAGIPELTHELEQFVGEIRAPRQMFVNAVSDVIAPHIEQRFAAQGPGWAPLSPRYAAWKREHFPGKPILERMGTMRAALTDRSRFGGAQSAFGPNVLDIAPKGIPYFATHQQGRGKIPARPMIVMSELDAPLRHYFDSWLQKRARDFGLAVKA